MGTSVRKHIRASGRGFFFVFAVIHRRANREKKSKQKVAFYRILPVEKVV